MPYNFDEIIERRATDSVKWSKYEPDVLPLWVADMDFRSPEPVIQALRERVEQRVFGYVTDPTVLRETICQRVQSRHNWKVEPDYIVFLPEIVTGLNVVSHAVGQPGDGVLMLTPIYHPFLAVPPNNARFARTVEMPAARNGRFLRYEIDFDAFESAITPQTRLLLFCNPHNPIGRVYTQDELEHLAAICLKRGVTLCADEIHSDLLFDGNRHVPLASLSPEIAGSTITLMGPSKTFNLPSLCFGFAVIPDEPLRKRVAEVVRTMGRVSVFGFAAALAAYRDGQPWLDALLVYLQANRDTLIDYVQERLPGVTMTKPEGTYLGWLDCRGLGIEQDTPFEFFLREARVALQDGAIFGRGGEGFVRLNFGCPRSTLLEALERMHAALDKRTGA